MQNPINAIHQINATKVIYAFVFGLFMMFIAYNLGKNLGKFLAEKEKTEIVSHIS